MQKARQKVVQRFGLNVVHFDKQTSASHSIHWYKSFFQRFNIFFGYKHKKLRKSTETKKIFEKGGLPA